MKLQPVRTIRRNFAPLFGSLALLLISNGTGLSQGPGGEQGPPGGPQGGRFGQGRGFPGQGGFAGPVIGTITGGDLSTGQIQIQSQFGGDAQVIHVSNATKVVVQQTVTVAELKVGDEVTITLDVEAVKA